MVTFPISADGWLVVINGNPFGHISREHGFFTDSTVVQRFTIVTPEDLHAIAYKVKIVQMQPWPCICQLSLPNNAAITVDGYLRCQGCKRVYNMEGNLIEGHYSRRKKG